MRHPKLIQLLISAILVALTFVGCGVPASTPTPIVIVVTATTQVMPTATPDLIATDVARQRAVAATLTAEAPKPAQMPTPLPTATRLLPTATPTFQNRLRNLQCSDDPTGRQKRLQCMVEYSYNGEWGADKIFVSATGWNNTPAQILEIYSDRQPITPGEGLVELFPELHDAGTYYTSQLQVCMFAEGSVPRFYCQFWPYAKTWKK